MSFYVAWRLHGFTLKIQLSSCLHVMMLSSMLGVCLSFFAPVFSVLDMVLLCLSVSYCLKAGCLITLNWSSCFDLLIPIKGLLASLRGVLYWGTWKLLMEYLLHMVKSIEDEFMWDCANATSCINISICPLSYCLAKYFNFFKFRDWVMPLDIFVQLNPLQIWSPWFLVAWWSYAIKHQLPCWPLLCLGVPQ